MENIWKILNEKLTIVIITLLGILCIANLTISKYQKAQVTQGLVNTIDWQFGSFDGSIGYVESYTQKIKDCKNHDQKSCDDIEVNNYKQFAMSDFNYSVRSLDNTMVKYKQLYKLLGKEQEFFLLTNQYDKNKIAVAKISDYKDLVKNLDLIKEISKQNADTVANLYQNAMEYYYSSL
ncbi:hypothetical protein IB642_06080 [Allofrancisella guangzhouensis]|nr:hypothetical protein [Allofrancisella guangzhouensis]MBK2027164.1 hypothetical protein [Allofrancisella guangzhouensis]MBK2044588.1 hypothetical protein [Allofrancisella guangzhouensis]MBK2045994.1 hypothetical protein [Allofrancisella guangzhouensis]